MAMMSVMTMPARVAESSSTQFWHTVGEERPKERWRVFKIREPSLPLRSAPGSLMPRPKLGKSPAESLDTSTSNLQPKKSLRRAKKLSQLCRNLNEAVGQPLSQPSPYCLGHKVPIVLLPLSYFPLRAPKSGSYHYESNPVC